MRSILIAEEYLLLTMKDDGYSSVSARDTGVAGALLSELDDRGRLGVLDPTSTGDEVLDEVLLRIGEKTGKKPKDVLGAIGKGMPRALLERLARAEIVQEDPTSVLGMRMWSAWPFVDTRHRDALREELLQVLKGQRQPDARTGTLVSLLQATSAWGPALPKDARHGMKMSEIRSRAKEIGKGRWGSEAVAKAIEEVNAAVMVAVTVSATTSSS